MLENLPLSAYAICYGPLALVILGFIVFASLTDANARRTYLRRLDLRPESERPVDEPFPVKEPIRAETPAGGVVIIMPEPKADERVGDAIGQLPGTPQGTPA